MTCVIDREQLHRRLNSINLLIKSHAGAVELVEVASDGIVSVRYTGMCAGCEYRPVTSAATLVPALRDVPGVRGVLVVGSSVSLEADERIAQTLDSASASARAVRLVRRIEGEQQLQTQ